MSEKADLKNDILYFIGTLFDEHGDGDECITDTAIADLTVDQYPGVFSHRSFRYWAGEVRRSRQAARELVESLSNVPIDHYIEKISLSEMIERKKAEINNSTERTENEGSIGITFKGSTPITNRQEFIDFYEIDESLYSIKQLVFKSWTTSMKLKSWEIKQLNDKDAVLYHQKPIQLVNYGCNGIIVDKVKTKEEELNDILKYIDEYKSPYSVIKGEGSGDGVYFSGDYHLGLITESYSVEVFIDRLEQMASEINADNKERVHLGIVGDLIEAGSIMHFTQVWELDSAFTGVAGARAVYEILKKHLFDKIKNLSSIYLVAGNHGRLTPNKKETDPNANVSQLVYYFLKDNMPPEVVVEYNRAVLSFKVDGIGYILTHGDLILSKKHINLILDYGFSKEQVCYHVMIQGHLHSRKETRAASKKLVTYNDRQIIVDDNQNYRAIQLTSLCDSNMYARDMGMSGSAGFLKIERGRSVDGRLINNVRTLDIPLI